MANSIEYAAESLVITLLQSQAALATINAASGIVHGDVAPLIQARLEYVESTGTWRVRTSVLMPDHLHLVVTLGADADLSQALRALKGPLSAMLRIHGLRWQESYYDHRLRPGDKLLPVFLYVFMNPYRSGLLKPDEKWPWYRCAPDDWEWFGGMTNQSCPFPEWLA
jgi:putative transposase